MSRIYMGFPVFIRVNPSNPLHPRAITKEIASNELEFKFTRHHHVHC